MCRRDNKLFWLWIAMLFVSFLGIVGVVYYMSSSPNTVCTSFECQRIAAEFNGSMDHTVDPCDDFYQYTCGNWERQHPQPNDTTLHDWSAIITASISERLHKFLVAEATPDEPKPVRQAKAIFKTCMDGDLQEKLGFTPLFQLLKEVGLPNVPRFMRPTSTKQRHFDWIRPIVKIKQALNIQVLVNFEIAPELTNGNVNRVVFDLPKASNETAATHALHKSRRMRKRSIRLKSEDEDSDEDDEEEEVDNRNDEDEESNQRIVHITQIFNAVLNSSKRTSPVSLELIVEAAMRIVEIEERLNEFIAAAENSTDTSKILADIRNMTVAELEKQVSAAIPSRPGITIFEKYLDLVFENAPAHLKFNLSSEKVLTSQSDIQYFSDMINYLIEDLGPIQIELYLWWRVVETAAIDTTEAMRLLYAKYNTELDEVITRSDYCITDVESFMGLAVSGAIISQEFLDEKKPKIKRMFENIRDAFAQFVRELDWMDPMTKQQNLEKLDVMKTLIGFPEWLLDKTALEDYYKGLELTHKSHLSSRVEVQRWILNKDLLEWRMQPKLKWETTPTTVNAFYLPRSNAIVLPQAFLQYAYYHLGLESLNYGSLGTFIGHELTHGFDNTGRALDKFGNYNEQFDSNATNEQYDERAKCFIEQYGRHTIPELIDANIDGELTLDENIADNGGLREAFLAYHLYQQKFGPEEQLPGFENFTSEQLFFLSFGNSRCEIYSGTGAREQIEDQHAPGRVRVNAVLSNSDDFKRAFHCKIGSGMFPEEHEQCQIW